jgi:hypothetical protein
VEHQICHISTPPHNFFFSLRRLQAKSPKSISKADLWSTGQAPRQSKPTTSQGAYVASLLQEGLVPKRRKHNRPVLYSRGKYQIDLATSYFTSYFTSCQEQTKATHQEAITEGRMKVQKKKATYAHVKPRTKIQTSASHMNKAKDILISSRSPSLPPRLLSSLKKTLSTRSNLPSKSKSVGVTIKVQLADEQRNHLRRGFTQSIH